MKKMLFNYERSDGNIIFVEKELTPEQYEFWEWLSPRLANRVWGWELTRPVEIEAKAMSYPPLWEDGTPVLKGEDEEGD